MSSIMWSIIVLGKDCLPLMFYCCPQSETDHSVNDGNPHIANIGQMIEVRDDPSLGGGTVWEGRYCLGREVLSGWRGTVWGGRYL